MNNQEIIENLQRQVAEKRRLQLLEQEEQEHMIVRSSRVVEVLQA